jgi:multiple sugar transport system substrate-binding protein
MRTKIWIMTLIFAMASAFAFSQQVTLTMAGWGGTSEPQFKRILAEFERTHPNIKVQYSVITGNDYWTKLQLGFATGTGYDVFWMHPKNAYMYMPQGVLLDLQPYMDADKFNLGAYDEKFKIPFRYKGDMYAIPSFYNDIVAFYNKKILKDAGVDFPKANWTWDDFLALGKKLTKRDNGKATLYGLGSDIAGETFLYDFILQNGGKIYSDDKTKCVIDSPANRETFQWLLDLIYKQQVFPTPSDLAETNSRSMFQGNMIAIEVDGSWMLKAYADALGIDNLGIAELPMHKVKGSVVNNNGYAAMAKTKHPKEAWELLKFLAGQYSSQVISELYIPCPSGDSGMWVPQYHGVTGFNNVFSTLAFSTPYPFAKSNINQAEDVFLQHANRIFSSPELAPDALANMQSEMNDAINK